MEIVGRADAMLEVARRLERSRLVTITGPGGMGKTTLADAVAREVGGSYELGIHRVDLTRIDDEADVGGAIAAQLGFGSFRALLASPSDQPALLLIDNCEHVLDAAADAIDQLLAACRSPTVLATSRSPLGLPIESVVVLGPLALPAVGLVDPEAPAVDLFRRRASDAGATSHPDDLESIVRLCRLLDGVPLAIELAAARSRLLTPSELLERLDVLDTLRRPRSRGPARHRSLRDTIEWSYTMLDVGDRAFFDRLAVLSGPFAADDAIAVAGADGSSDDDVLERLARLLDASLLTSEAVAGVTHHRQLELVRAYARERLHERGEWDSTWRRFVDHVTHRSIRLAVDTATGWSGTVLASLLNRVDHQLAVLRWCVRHDDGPNRTFALIASLWGVVHQGRVDEIAPLVDQALERWPEPTVPAWPDAIATAATCHYLLGAPLDAIALARSALPHAESSAYAPSTLRRVVAHASCAIGDVDGAIAALDEAIVLAATRVPALAMEMTVSRAELAANRGEIDAGLEQVRAVAHDAVRRDALVNAVWARSVEAALVARADPHASIALATSALEQSRRLMYPACESVNLHTLAVNSIASGDLPAAASHLLELIDGLVTRGAEGEVRNALRTSAVVLHRSGEPWTELAAAARAMPVVSLFELPGHERLDLPDADARPIDRGAAIVLARDSLRRVRDAVHTVQAPTPHAPTTVAPLVPTPTNHWYRVGDVWTIVFDGASVQLAATKGLADLGRLIAAPGTEFHCLDLAEAVVEEHASGELLDERARREYEQRVRDLQREIDEAEHDHDLARADRSRLELDAIVDHLTAALGLGGRARRHTDTTERARSAVTQRIRASIKRIETDHPALGAHLRASVQTGIYCRYQPERPTVWATNAPA